MGLIKIEPDRQKALSLLDTLSVRLGLIVLMKKTDVTKYASKITEEYYETALELITALMYLDGYKTRSDLPGAHKETIKYLQTTYREFTEKEIWVIDDFRERRNGIKYYGRHVAPEFVKMYENQIQQVIEKLRSVLKKRLDQG